MRHNGQMGPLHPHAGRRIRYALDLEPAKGSACPTSPLTPTGPPAAAYGLAGAAIQGAASHPVGRRLSTVKRSAEAKRPERSGNGVLKRR